MGVETIYMPLVDEGTDVWRSVLAERLEAGLYRIVGPVPETEKWQFAPGSTVRVEMRRLSEGEMLVATAADQ
jgi:hypothetical protein